VPDGGLESLTMLAGSGSAGCETESKGTFEMVLWPAVALVGFLVLTALVIAMGTSTTARYEREQRASASPAPARAAEPVGARAA
jgi:hypothetical protein